jgi:hypothetical protein
VHGVCSCRRHRTTCGALGSRGDGSRAPPPPPPPPPDDYDDAFEDFPGADSARQWRMLPSDTRSLITVAGGFIAVPLLLSASLRLTVIDPLLFYLQADLREFDLTRALALAFVRVCCTKQPRARA